MKLLDLDELRMKIRNSRLTYAQLAQQTKLSRSWIAQFTQGRKNNPTFTTLKALLEALDDEQGIEELDRTDLARRAKDSRFDRS